MSVKKQGSSEQLSIVALSQYEHSTPKHVTSTFFSTGEADDDQECQSMAAPPPDGGLTAWLCVLGTHLVVMNTWGVINSFGVFQSYYVAALGKSPSDISWIGSFEIFLLFFVGIFAGRLTDAGYFHHVTITGSFLVVFGTLITSVCTRYWQIFLAQGVCVGLGNGCLFCPVIALVSTYFDKTRSLAIGLTACGSGFGGIIFPIIVHELLPRIGFGWTIRTIGFTQLGLLTIAMLCLKPRITPRKTGPIIEWAAFKELEYCFYGLGVFFCYWGSFFAFFFLPMYSRAAQGMSYEMSLELVIVMNGVGTIGRVLPNYIADRFGPVTLFVPTAGVGALLMFCWIAVSSPGGLCAWAAISGIAFGGIQSLFPSALASLTSDPRKQGSRIGLVFTIVSFSVLTGPPIGGALISTLNSRYLAAQSFAGGSLVVGTLFIAASREAKRRKTGGNLWDKV